jgi:hypothetical protein
MARHTSTSTASATKSALPGFINKAKRNGDGRSAPDVIARRVATRRKNLRAAKRATKAPAKATSNLSHRAGAGKRAAASAALSHAESCVEIIVEGAKPGSKLDHEALSNRVFMLREELRKAV